MSYRRTSEIKTERLGDGVIQGTLATNGEASDGHILDVRGIELPQGNVPLLFGHDAHSGRNNLGSWTDFRVMGNRRQTAELGDSTLVGTAQIELGGSGEQASFRQDVAHMIGEGHIGSFSIRWDPVGEAQRRSELPTDHYAYSEDRSGLYFERSRILEGSVVTIGADPAALIGRAMASAGMRSWIHIMRDEMLEELLRRVDMLESREPAALPITVPVDDTTAAVTEDSAPSAPEAESRPQQSLDVLVQRFAEKLDESDARIEQRYQNAMRRLVG